MLICTVLCFDKEKDNKAVTNINKQKRNKKSTAVKKTVKRAAIDCYYRIRFQFLSKNIPKNIQELFFYFKKLYRKPHEDQLLELLNQK